MKIFVVLLIFLIVFGSSTALSSSINPPSGYRYHFRDENSPNMTHTNWTQCEYIYNEDVEHKAILMIFQNEAEAGMKKIGFYCKDKFPECCGIDCCRSIRQDIIESLQLIGILLSIFLIPSCLFSLALLFSYLKRKWARILQTSRSNGAVSKKSTVSRNSTVSRDSTVSTADTELTTV